MKFCGLFLGIFYDFYRYAAFLVFFEEIALGVEAAENLAVGKVVSLAGAVQAGPEGGCYEENFFAALEDVWGFVKDCGVYDCFVVVFDEVVYPFCDDGVDY